jgi:hypothetical protein
VAWASRPRISGLSRNRSGGTPKPRNAFTLVELCIGLVVLAIVMGALAAFSLATAEAWKQGAVTNAVGNGDNTAAIPMIANVVSARLDNEIMSCAGVGGYYPGSLTDSSAQQTSILLWKQNLDSPATNIEPREVDLLEYDPTNHMIWKYTSAQTTPSITYTVFTTAWIATFKASATKVPFARNIDGMQINVNTPSSQTQLPLVEYRLYFNRAGWAQTRYGAVCVRSPTRASGQNWN